MKIQSLAFIICINIFCCYGAADGAFIGFACKSGLYAIKRSETESAYTCAVVYVAAGIAENGALIKRDPSILPGLQNIAEKLFVHAQRASGKELADSVLTAESGFRSINSEVQRKISLLGLILCKDPKSKESRMVINAWPGKSSEHVLPRLSPDRFYMRTIEPHAECNSIVALEDEESLDDYASSAAQILSDPAGIAIVIDAAAWHKR